MITLRYIYLFIFLFSLLSLPLPGAHSESQAAQHSSNWTMAIVFAYHQGTREYTGIVSNPVLPKGFNKFFKVQDLNNYNVTPGSQKVNYEIWLVNDGETLPIWYSSTTGKFGIMLGNMAADSHDDGGELKRIIRSAHPESPGHEIQPAAGEIVEYIGLASNLKQLYDISSRIILGQVVGILRVAHTPENSLNYEQHTVFIVAVENYLKATPPTEGGRAEVLSESTFHPALPDIVKVWQDGGNLPWNDSNGNTGIGFSINGSPLLRINNRYILFLKQPEASGNYNHQRGYVQASYNGVTGKKAELDEYMLADPLHGVVSLKNGITEPLVGFDEGPQLFHLSEKKAMEIIREQIGHIQPSLPSQNQPKFR